MKSVIKQALAYVGNLVPIKTKLSPNAARNTLNTFSTRPAGTCYTDNKVNLQFDLQIIIPCYNAEKWVRRCLESVLNQETAYKVLVSIVNDGSTDETENVIRDVIAQYSEAGQRGYTLELKTQENRGFSEARNAALKLIKGTFIAFLDSDDVLADGAINKMLDAAFAYDAEILQGGWYEFMDKVGVGEQNERTTEKIGEDIVSKTGLPADNRGVLSGYPWGKLYKHNVMEHFRFPEGFWFEDTPLSFLLAALPYRCVAIKEVVYGYCLNPEGISATSIGKKKSVDSYWITEACLEEFDAFGIKYDQRAYEYLLRQSITNAKRIRRQPCIVRRAIFVLTAELMEKYFAGFGIQAEEMRDIERALRKRQFLKFDLLTLGK